MSSNPYPVYCQQFPGIGSGKMPLRAEMFLVFLQLRKKFLPE